MILHEFDLLGSPPELSAFHTVLSSLYKIRSPDKLTGDLRLRVSITLNLRSPVSLSNYF